MNEVSVGAELVKQNGGLSYTDEKLVEMSNGCICCTLRDDLPKEVRRLADDRHFDHLVTGQMLRRARARHASNSRRKSPLPIGHKAKYSNFRAGRPD
jgi:hypothetical protein